MRNDRTAPKAQKGYDWAPRSNLADPLTSAIPEARFLIYQTGVTCLLCRLHGHGISRMESTGVHAARLRRRACHVRRCQRDTPALQRQLLGGGAVHMNRTSVIRDTGRTCTSSSDCVRPL